MQLLAMANTVISKIFLLCRQISFVVSQSFGFFLVKRIYLGM
jgi:hypothetical protein